MRSCVREKKIRLSEPNQYTRIVSLEEIGRRLASRSDIGGDDGDVGAVGHKHRIAPVRGRQ